MSKVKQRLNNYIEASKIEINNENIQETDIFLYKNNYPRMCVKIYSLIG